MALGILMRNRDVLEHLAQTLLDEESLEGDALKAFLAEIRLPADLHVWLNQGTLVSASTMLLSDSNGDRYHETTY